MPTEPDERPARPAAWVLAAAVVAAALVAGLVLVPDSPAPPEPADWTVRTDGTTAVFENGGPAGVDAADLRVTYRGDGGDGDGALSTIETDPCVTDAVHPATVEPRDSVAVEVRTDCAVERVRLRYRTATGYLTLGSAAPAGDGAAGPGAARGPADASPF